MAYPGEIFPSFPNAIQAELCRIIQKDDGITRLQTQLHGRSIVAVDNPLLLLQHSLQTLSEHLSFHRRPVGIPVHPIQIKQWQLGSFLQRTGKGTFPAARDIQ